MDLRWQELKKKRWQEFSPYQLYLFDDISSIRCSKIVTYPTIMSRAHSKLAPSQWETLLQSNTVSHWLVTNLESAQIWLDSVRCNGYWTIYDFSVREMYQVFQTCLTSVWRLPCNFTMDYIASSDKCLTFHYPISNTLWLWPERNPKANQVV